MDRDLYLRLFFEYDRKIQFLIGKNLPMQFRTEIAQDVWLLYFTKAMNKVDHTKINSAEEVLIILKRQAKDAKYESFMLRAREKKTLFNKLIGEDMDIPDSSPAIVEVFEQKDLLRQILERLYKHEVEFFNLAFVQEIKNSELATQLRCSLRAIRQRKYLLKKKIIAIYYDLRE